MKERKIKIGKFEVPSPNSAEGWEGWEIVNEVGVGKWIGRVIEEKQGMRCLTLQPALELPAPSVLPAMGIPAPGHGSQPLTLSGAGAFFMFMQPSDHPVRDIAYSSRQRVSEMSEDLRRYIYAMLDKAVHPEDAIHPDDLMSHRDHNRLIT